MITGRHQIFLKVVVFFPIFKKVQKVVMSSFAAQTSNFPIFNIVGCSVAYGLFLNQGEQIKQTFNSPFMQI